MTERVEDPELERALAEVGRRLAVPDRDLWPEVRRRIEARRVRRGSALAEIFGRRYLPAFATIALLLVVAALLSPDVRARAAETLGLRGIQIFRVPETPAPTARPTASVTPSPASFGRPVQTLAEASTAAGFSVRAPAALGQPDALYVDGSSSSVRVTLVYSSRPGIPVSPQAGVSALLVELRGTFDQNVMGKAVGPNTTLEAVRVNGGPGFWLAGEPHQFFYRDPSGNFQMETLRLAGNTLLWEERGITYRLEAQVSRDDALGIAASLR